MQSNRVGFGRVEERYVSKRSLGNVFSRGKRESDIYHCTVYDRKRGSFVCVELGVGKRAKYVVVKVGYLVSE